MGMRNLFVQGKPKSHLLHFWLIVLSLSACSRLDNLDVVIEPEVLDTPIILTLEDDPRFPVVSVAINGEAGFRFVLDTGATVSVIFMHEKAQDLGLEGIGSVGIGGSGDGENPKGQIVSDVDLSLGDLHFRDMSFLTLPASVSDNLHRGKEYPIDGVIGYDLFSRYSVTIDARADQVLILEARSYQVSDNAEILPLHTNGATAISGGRSAFVDARLALGPSESQDRFNLHLDTGSSLPLSLIPDSHRSIEKPANAWLMNTVGINGIAPVVRRPFGALLVSDRRLEGFSTAFAPRGRSTKGRHGRIGHGMLKRFVYTVDYVGERLILEPHDASYKAYPSGYLGFSYSLEMQDDCGGAAQTERVCLRVFNIREDGPAAEAALEEGVYSRLNGRHVADIDKTELDTFFRLDAGETVELCRRTECWTIHAADINTPPILKD